MTWPWTRDDTLQRTLGRFQQTGFFPLFPFHTQSCKTHTYTINWPEQLHNHKKKKKHLWNIKWGTLKMSFPAIIIYAGDKRLIWMSYSAASFHGRCQICSCTMVRGLSRRTNNNNNKLVLAQPAPKNEGCFSHQDNNTEEVFMLSAGISRMLVKHIIIFCCPDLRLKISLMLSLCLLLIYISHFLKDAGFLTISRHA